MTYLFELNHPKHYYQFKYVMRMLQDKGHDVHVVARDKDVLLDVLRQENVPFLVFGNHYKGMTKKVLGTIPILFNYAGIVRRIKPDVIVSKASFYGCLMARLFGRKSIIFPDSEVVKITNRYVVPLATRVVTPATFGLDYGKKHFRVKGFFEDCYLAPSVFTPDEQFIATAGVRRPYAIFRFVGWNANHDVGNKGFSIEQIHRMVDLVSQRMQVYISSEKHLPEDLANHKLPIPAAKMHHALAFAELYLGDSQTMATEAALLGTPAIRSNSFVGENDMTNFKVLEKEYGLLYNIAKFEDVMQALDEMSATSKKELWLERRKEYFNKVGDANASIADLLENI